MIASEDAREMREAAQRFADAPQPREHGLSCRFWRNSSCDCGATAANASHETRESDDEKIAFWDCDDDREQLLYTEIEEAVEAWADRQDGPLPETVEVFGFARKELPSALSIARWTLEDLFEWLDDEHGDPSESTVATDALHAAALQFAEVLRKEYTVWMCERATSRVVKVADYYHGDA